MLIITFHLRNIFTWLTTNGPGVHLSPHDIRALIYTAHIRLWWIHQSRIYSINRTSQNTINIKRIQPSNPLSGTAVIQSIPRPAQTKNTTSSNGVRSNQKKAGRQQQDLISTRPRHHKKMTGRIKIIKTAIPAINWLIALSSAEHYYKPAKLNAIITIILLSNQLGYRITTNKKSV